MANNPAIERALKQAGKAEVFLAEAAETAKARLERSLRELERRVIEEAAKLGAGQKSFGLTQAQQLHAQLAKLFKETYGEEVKDHVRGYKKVAAMAGKYFAPFPEVTESFATIDPKLLQSLELQTVATLEAFGQEAQNRIAQALYNSAVAGRPFGRLLRDIEGALTGHQDVKGRPLAQYAKTYAQDGLMETYAATHQQAAQRAGLKHYLYFGTAVGDSRPFCLARMGKVFTRDEVQSWESLDWAGKKPGAILLVRGGWNCRHQLLPVAPEWIPAIENKHAGQHKTEQVRIQKTKVAKIKHLNVGGGNYLEAREIGRIHDRPVYASPSLSADDPRVREVMRQMGVALDNISKVVPTKLMKGLKELRIFDRRNPADSYWAAQYNIAGFRSAATGGHGRISIWDALLENPDGIESTIYHELGHVTAQQKYQGRYHPPNWEQLTKTEGWVSAYSAASKALSENFADTFRMFFANPDGLRNAFPAKADYLERKFLRIPKG